MEQIQIAVNQIPNVLEYFVSGFILVSIVNIIGLNLTVHWPIRALTSIAISFAIKSLSALTIERLGMSHWIVLIIEMVFGALVGIALGVMLKTRKVNYAMHKLFGTTTAQNALDLAIMFSKSSNLHIIKKDGTSVYGVLVTYDPRRGTEWISVQDYTEYDDKMNELRGYDSDKQYNVLVIKLDEVAAIRVVDPPYSNDDNADN